MNMTKEQMAQVMIEAKPDGSNVEYCERLYPHRWEPCEGPPCWNWGYEKYRIRPEPTPADYLRGHRECGIKVGDKVRVTRKAESRSGGWEDSWAPEMTDSVGCVFEVVKDNGADGYVLCNGFHYPYFILERVEEAKPATVAITMDDLALMVVDGGWYKRSTIFPIGDFHRLTTCCANNIPEVKWLYSRDPINGPWYPANAVPVNLLPWRASK